MGSIVRRPSATQIAKIAENFGMDLRDDEARIYAQFIAPIMQSYDRLDELLEPKPAVKYARTPGHRPSLEEDPHRAWYWKSEIKGASEGILAGRGVAIKDNICVAGVPMMNGARLLEGYIPDIDATVVTRVLESGGTIVGKAACEALCLSSQSYTCESGPILNPRRTTHSAGGSSGGNAALVAAGEVAISIGGDQGGSIRTPSAWCGIYGLKPSWGLVPATGAMPIAYAMDHLGPMCDSPENVARLLTAIAGADPMDPRTTLAKVGDYMGALGRGVSGVRIGVLRQGFGLPNSDPSSDEIVRKALSRFEKLGAVLSELDIPAHLEGVNIHTGIVMEGAAQLIFEGNGQGDNWNGYYTTSLIEAFGRAWRSRPDDVPPTGKVMLFLGKYMRDNYHGRYHAKAQNMKPWLTAHYDRAFQDVDIIAMPTIPHTADPLPTGDHALIDFLNASNMLQNTMPFDVSGHPAFSIPCGTVDGLPVGLMLVGRNMDEETLIAAAQAFARDVDWTSSELAAAA